MSEFRRLDDDAVADLVQRALTGDAGARDALLARCHGTIYRWALVHTGDPDDAADVAQEVLVTLHARLDRYRGRSRFTTWLYQVTRNAARGLGRRIAGRLRLVRRLSREPAVSRPASPLDRLATSETGALVARLFLELPRRQREILYLVDLEGLGAAEIGARFGLKPATVRVHLLRARRTLRALIIERHPELAEGHRP